MSDSSRENEFMWYLVLEYGTCTKKFRFLVRVSGNNLLCFFFFFGIWFYTIG